MSGEYDLMLEARQGDQQRERNRGPESVAERGGQMKPPRQLPSARVYVFEGGDIWGNLATWVKGFEGQVTIVALSFRYDEEAVPEITIVVEE